MRQFLISAMAFVCAVVPGFGQASSADRARTWLHQAADALGGEGALRNLAASEISGLAVQYQREQSERPEGPWVATYSEFTDVRNFAANAIQRKARTRGYSTPDWVDNPDWQPLATTLVVDDVGLRSANGRWTPAGTPWDIGTMPLAYGPERCVIAALDAPDLRSEQDVPLNGYPHHVVSFTRDNARVRIILNPPSMLPKAVEITRARPYEIFWTPWGDVTQRLTFGIWTLESGGVRFPRLWEYSTGGQPDGRVDITRVRLNPQISAADFVIPDDVRQTYIVHRRRVADTPFGSSQRPAKELAPGVVKVPASWDIVEVREDDGVVIVEGPLSSGYSVKVIDDARKRFATAVVKAVITTSDSWPHIGGLREYVARGIPVYALDLNVPILQRLFAAPYTTFPDALARGPKTPQFRIVSAKTVVGTGANRMEIYPLRTVTGERQMMIYWPAHALLYTSDLFSFGPDGSVFLPQQVSEAVGVVSREHLTVQSAFGMHYDLVPWEKVVASAQPPR